MTDVDESAAAAVAGKMNAAGLTADSAPLDVRDRSAADTAVARAAALADGTLHILVNNAGVIAPAMFDKLEEEAFRRVLDIHVMGTFHCAQAALPFLPDDGRGRIINVTSSAGLVGTLGQVNYSAAKAGIIGLTKSLARELARRRVLVNALAPLAATPMTETIRTNEKFAAQMLARIPLGRWAQPHGDRGQLRVPRLGRGLLHHGAGAAGGRGDGDVRGGVRGVRRGGVPGLAQAARQADPPGSGGLCGKLTCRELYEPRGTVM